MPTRRKFRRNNNRKSRRRGKRGGKLGRSEVTANTWEFFKVTSNTPGDYKFPSQENRGDFIYFLKQYYMNKVKISFMKQYRTKGILASAILQSVNSKKKSGKFSSLGINKIDDNDKKCVLFKRRMESSLKEIVQLALEQYEKTDDGNTLYKEEVKNEIRRMKKFPSMYKKILNGWDDFSVATKQDEKKWNEDNYYNAMKEILAKPYIIKLNHTYKEGMLLGPFITNIGRNLGGGDGFKYPKKFEWFKVDKIRGWNKDDENNNMLHKSLKKEEVLNGMDTLITEEIITPYQRTEPQMDLKKILGFYFEMKSDIVNPKKEEKDKQSVSKKAKEIENASKTLENMKKNIGENNIYTPLWHIRATKDDKGAVNVAFPMKNIEEKMKNLTMHYYIAKCNKNQNNMNTSLGLCYLLALQQIKDLFIFNDNDNNFMPDVNENRKLFVNLIKLEQKEVIKRTMKEENVGGGKQFETMMTSYGGTLYKCNYGLQTIEIEDGNNYNNPLNFKTVFKNLKINLLRKIINCLDKSEAEEVKNKIKEEGGKWKIIKNNISGFDYVRVFGIYDQINAKFYAFQKPFESKYDVVEKLFVSKNLQEIYDSSSSTPEYIPPEWEQQKFKPPEKTTSDQGGGKRRRRKRRTKRGGKSRRRKRRTKRSRRRKTR